MNKIKDNITRWRDIPCSWEGRINIVKMTILPNAVYRFNVIPVKLPMTFFTELEQKNSQFVWKHKRPWIAKAVLRKKNRAGESTFLTSDYTIVIKTVWYWQKNRNTCSCPVFPAPFFEETCLFPIVYSFLLCKK